MNNIILTCSAYKKLWLICILYMGCLGYSQTDNSKDIGLPREDILRSKESYIANLKGKSLEDIKQILSEDKDRVKTALDSLLVWKLYMRTSLRLTSGFEVSKENNLTKDLFKFYDVNTALKEFREISKVNYYQKWAHPSSEFTVYLPNRVYSFDESDIDEFVEQIYHKGKAYSLETIGMYAADSIKTKLLYHYPTAYDSIVIDLVTKKDIKYNELLISKVDIEDTEVYFRSTPGLNVISTRGITDEGDILKSTYSHRKPVLVIRPEVVKLTTKFIQNIDRALQTKDVDKIIKSFESLENDDYICTRLLLKAYTILDEFDDDSSPFPDEASLFNELSSNYKAVFGVEYLSNRLEYKKPVSKVVLYLGKDYKEESSYKMAYPAHKHLVPYPVYNDTESGKYGIATVNSEIVIPAIYRNLHYVDFVYEPLALTYYYVEQLESDEYQYYYLDVNKKQLLPLEAGIYYGLSYDEFGLFRKDSYSNGVYRGIKNIVPFKYHKILFTRSMIIGEYTKRGRVQHDFYTMEGQFISTPADVVAKKHSMNENEVVVSNIEGEYSIMNERGELIRPFEDIDIAYIQAGMFKYKENNLYGIMDTKGKKITKAIYESVDYFADDRLAVSKDVDGKTKYGYINSKMEEVIPIVYKEAESFVKGYALVKLDSIWNLIDSNGKVIKELGDFWYVRNFYRYTSTEHLSDDVDVYKIGEDYYNYKGEKVKPKDI
jgi:hypothetical protein